MKRLSYIIGLAVLAVISSCSLKEEIASTPQQKIFRAVMEDLSMDSDTKAFAEEDFNVYWNTNDLLSIFYDRTYNRQYIYTARDRTPAGPLVPNGDLPPTIIDAEIRTEYDYAIYPYNLDNSCDYDGTLTVVFPQERTYVPHSYPTSIGADMVLAARTTDGAFFFKHVAGYIGLQLYGEGLSVSSITFKSNNAETLSGYPLVVFDGEDPLLTFYSWDPDNSDTMTINYDPAIEIGASSDEATMFWLTLPPSILTKGFTLTVKDSDGGVFTKRVNSSFVISRKVFKTLTPLEVIPTVSVSGVTLDKTSAELEVGKTTTLTATVLPATAPNKNVTWETSNESVATVDENGIVTAVTPGTATITVTTEEGGKTAKCTITVKSGDISYRLAITPATAEINVGDTQEYTVTLTTTKNGVSTDSSITDYTLTVDDTATAIADGSVVTGKAAGTTGITVKYTPSGSAEITATASLTVKAVEISYALEITPAEATIKIGDTQVYAVTLKKTVNGETTSEILTGLTLTFVGEEEGVASAEEYRVTGLKKGEIKVKVEYTPEGSDKLTAEAKLAVSDKNPNEAGDPIGVDPDENF